MPDKFPGPKYSQVIDENADSQIRQVPLKNQDWGARKVSTDLSWKNEQKIKHVADQGS